MRLQSQGVSNGQIKPTSALGEFNNVAFVVAQMINKVQTAMLVRVDSVTNSGGVEAVGYVSVTPLVDMVDGAGKSIPHSSISNIPYFRIQGGSNAIIIDPQVGDIGLCIFASRDITRVKRSKKQSAPASHRKYHYSDGLYVGGFLNNAPTQYMRFSESGIELLSPNAITITAPSMTLNGTLTLNGSMTSTGDVVANGISLDAHVHGGVVAGASNTGTPL